jgi:hypothetical protein
MSKLTFYENGETMVKTATTDSILYTPKGLIPESILVVGNRSILDYSLNVDDDKNIQILKASLGKSIDVAMRDTIITGILYDYKFTDDILELYMKNDDNDALIWAKDPKNIWYSIDAIPQNNIEIPNNKGCTITYITTDITATASYILILNKSMNEIDLFQCNLKIDNASDITWTDIPITFVIGEVNKIKSFNPNAKFVNYQTVASTQETKTSTTDYSEYTEVEVVGNKNIYPRKITNAVLFEIYNLGVKLIYRYDLSINSDLNKASWGIQFNTGNNNFPSGNIIVYQSKDNITDFGYIGSNNLETSLITNYDKTIYLGKSSDLVGTHNISITEDGKINTFNINVELSITSDVKKVDKLLLYYDNWELEDAKVTITTMTIQSNSGKLTLDYLGFLYDGIYFTIDKLIPGDNIKINIVFTVLKK